MKIWCRFRLQEWSLCYCLWDQWQIRRSTLDCLNLIHQSTLCYAQRARILQDIFSRKCRSGELLATVDQEWLAKIQLSLHHNIQTQTRVCQDCMMSACSEHITDWALSAICPLWCCTSKFLLKHHLCYILLWGIFARSTKLWSRMNASFSREGTDFISLSDLIPHCQFSRAITSCWLLWIQLLSKVIRGIRPF